MADKINLRAELRVSPLPADLELEDSSADQEPTVFVIDDDAMGRDSVRALVTSMGLLCSTFSSAEEFLEECPDSPSGCLVVDVMMPGMTGLELQEQIAKSGLDLPVIMISAFGRLSTAIQAMQQGAITFLEKPCNEYEFVQRDSKCLGS